MAPLGWASPDQRDFLTSQLPSYFAAQKNSDFTGFWATLFETWEAQFPTRECLFPGRQFQELTPDEQKSVSNAIESKRAQLQTWYRWRSTPKARAVDKISSKLDEVLDAGSRTRLDHKYEIYYRLYKDKLQPHLDLELQVDKKWARGEKLALRNRILRRLWEEETDDDIKTAVNNDLAQTVKNRDLATQPSEKRTPLQYAKAIEDLPAFLHQVFKGLNARSGWSFSVLMGGPDPANGGDINVASYHIGFNAAGRSFSEASTSFERDYMAPYTDFLCQVYSPEVRKSRALSNDEGGQEKEESAVARVDIGFATAPVPTVPPANFSGVPVAVSTPMTAEPVVNAVPEVILAPVLVAAATPAPLATSEVNTMGLEALPVPITPPPSANAVPEGGSTTILVPATPSPMPTSGGSVSMPITTSFPAPAAGAAFNFDASPTALMDNFLDMFDTPVAAGNGADNFSFDTSALADYDWSTTSAYFAQLNASAPLVSDPAALTPVIPPAPAAMPVIPPAPAAPTLVIPPAEPQPSVLPASSCPSVDGLGSVNILNTSAQRSRSGRQITASKKAEEMNKIGGPNLPAPVGKENIAPTAEARPAWRIAAEAHLTLTDYGADWDNCVKAWSAVEDTITSAGSRSGLPAKSRPDEWQKWIARSTQGTRSYASCPVIDDPLEFGYAVMAWWKQLQPDFRSSSDVLPLPVYDPPVEGTDPWATLRKGGPNGLVAIMTLLLWWRQAFARRSHWQDDSEPFWTRLVQDVLSCLNKIVSTPPAQKRKRGGDAATSSKRSKKNG
ncbi:hypothetical protein H0H92_015235 [Tricholoma furcatifolium]|nr:hypothetical protein H0H92_015235 [Tricholoma furcatifolium]